MGALLAGWIAAGWLNAPLLALSLAAAESRRLRWKAIGAAAALALLGTASLRILRQIQWRLGNPTEWDFLPLWLMGRVAWLGRDPYAPASYADQALPLRPNAEFRIEFLELGALYPPPSILLFAPLGALPFETAQVLWYGVKVLVLGGCGLLLGRIFFRGSLLPAAIPGAALVLALPGTTATFIYGQGSLFVLLLVLLAIRDAGRPRAGAWIVLAAVVKPWVAFVGLLPLLRRDRATVGVMICTAAAWVAASVFFLGHDVFKGFVLDPPWARAPDFLLSQPVNQSLLAVKLRLLDGQAGLGGIAIQAGAYAAGAGILLSTLWLVATKVRNDAANAMSLLLTGALLLYPHSLWHYSATLALPLAWLWSTGLRPIVGARTTALLLAVLVVAATVQSGRFVFAVNAAIWVLLVAATWAARSRRGMARGREDPAGRRSPREPRGAGSWLGPDASRASAPRVVPLPSS